MKRFNDTFSQMLIVLVILIATGPLIAVESPEYRTITFTKKKGKQIKFRTGESVICALKGVPRKHLIGEIEEITATHIKIAGQFVAVEQIARLRARRSTALDIVYGLVTFSIVATFAGFFFVHTGLLYYFFLLTGGALISRWLSKLFSRHVIQPSKRYHISIQE